MPDYYLFNGELKRGEDLKFVQLLKDNKASDECVLILVTPGGSPDAAYKIARYIQSKYTKFSVFVSGFCKSAGTLLAIGANELIFMPYGELGPLDVQMAKVDQIAALESGLNIGEALALLELRARETYNRMIFDIIGSSGGVISFNTASHASNEFVSSVYGPIFSRIDPEEVGSRGRAMRIGEDYGKRLSSKGNNLKSKALETLSQSYSSHGFVIDFEEAKELFTNIRMATAQESEVILKLGPLARHPDPSPNAVMLKLDDAFLSSTIHVTDHTESTKEQTDATNTLQRKRRPVAASTKRGKANGRDTPSTAAKNPVEAQ